MEVLWIGTKWRNNVVIKILTFWLDALFHGYPIRDYIACGNMISFHVDDIG